MAEADKSIDLLVRAVADGERYPGRLQTESAFDPLHDHPDFRLLMFDLAFPAQPFARDD
jgi:eukaryotic-like serine/threonine-protein kinase